MASEHNNLRELGGKPSTSRDDDEDDTTLEQDPSHRFSRYHQTVGSGRFKRVYKGFDEKRGIDVAWSKIERHVNNMTLDDETMEKITAEMSKGLALEHPNIIKCYSCWHDMDAHCINLITEFFTSGNLRDYRQRHKHLELKAVRKWARQILSGLDYLHLKQPPVIHGDLRCDKIYINGHSGEIKIGDLGLATLLPKRFSPGAHSHHALHRSLPAAKPDCSTLQGGRTCCIASVVLWNDFPSPHACMPSRQAHQGQMAGQTCGLRWGMPP